MCSWRTKSCAAMPVNLACGSSVATANKSSTCLSRKAFKIAGFLRNLDLW